MTGQGESITGIFHDLDKASALLSLRARIVAPFPCPECEEFFITIVGLAIHYQTRHPIPNKTSQK